MDRHALAIHAVLDRQVASFSPLPSAIEVLSAKQRPSAQGQRPLAIGFDTNALFEIINHRQADDIVDLLNTIDIPLVLPGQCVQEFWNNKLAGITTLREKAKTKLEDLEKVISQIVDDVGLTEEVGDLRDAVEAFSKKHSELTDTRRTQAASALFAMLERRGVIAYFPRSALLETANSRMLSKAPPGFRDAPKLGDMYVWADFLLGASRSIGRGKKAPPSYVAFVSIDRKPDWELNGRPHPLLSGEVSHVLKCGLDVLNVDELRVLLVSLRSSA